MSVDANFASTPKAAIVVVSTANTSRAQTASNTGITVLYAAGASGSRIDDIVITPNATTTAGMIRFWLHDGTNNTFWREYAIAAATVTATAEVITTTITNLGLQLQSGWTLKVSTNNAEAITVAVTKAGDY